MKTNLKVLLVALLTLFVGFASSEVNAQKKKKKMETVYYSAEIHCGGCKAKIEKNIPFERGVKSVIVDMKKNSVIVTFDPKKNNKDVITAALLKLEIPVKEIPAPKKEESKK